MKVGGPAWRSLVRCAGSMSLSCLMAQVSYAQAAPVEAVTFPASPQFILAPEVPPHLPLRLLSIALSQDGNELSGERPAIEGDRALVVRETWMPEIRIASSAPMRIRFWDGLGLISRDFPFRVGPGRSESPWPVGSEYTTEHVIDMSEVSSAFSGDAYVEVSMETPRNPTQPYEPILLLPVNVAAHPTENPALAGAWKNAMGPNVQLIPYQVRLGKGAACSLPVPEGIRMGNEALAIASSMSYQGPSQGQTVCVVVLHTPQGDISLPIRVGIETARCDFDAYPPGKLHQEKPRIFQSRDSAQLGVNNRPVQLHTYLGVIPIPANVSEVLSITLRCDGSTIIDIAGLALLPTGFKNTP